MIIDLLLDSGEIGNGDLYFSTIGYGLVCGAEKCKKMDNQARKISRGTLLALKHIVESETKEVFDFSVSDRVLSELSIIIPEYLRCNMDRKYTKLDFLQTL